MLRSLQVTKNERKRERRCRKADIDRELDTKDNPCEKAISWEVVVFNSR